MRRLIHSRQNAISRASDEKQLIKHADVYKNSEHSKPAADILNDSIISNHYCHLQEIPTFWEISCKGTSQNVI